MPSSVELKTWPLWAQAGSSKPSWCCVGLGELRCCCLYCCLSGGRFGRASGSGARPAGGGVERAADRCRINLFLSLPSDLSMVERCDAPRMTRLIAVFIVLSTVSSSYQAIFLTRAALGPGPPTRSSRELPRCCAGCWRLPRSPSAAVVAASCRHRLRRPTSAHWRR